MKTRSRSFSAKLSLNIVVIVSIVFVVAHGIVAYSSLEFMGDESRKLARNIMRVNSSEIEKKLQAVEIYTGGAVPVVRNAIGDSTMLYKITRNIVESNPDIVGSAIAFRENYFGDKYYFAPFSWSDSSGTILSKQLGNEQYDYFCMDWYLIPFLKKEACWSEPYYDEGGGDKLICTYSIPIRDDDGEVFAILTADVSIDWISKKVSEIKPYNNSAMIIVSKNGTYVGHPDIEAIKGETLFSFCYNDKSPKTLEIGREMIAGKDSMIRFRNNYGDWAFAIFGPLSNGWSSAIICREKDVLDRAVAMSTILLVVGILGLAALFIVCYRTVRKHTKPLTEFSESALSIAGGNFNTELPKAGDGEEVKEMKVLRDSFDTLQKSLVEYIRNLKESTAANERFESELNIAHVIQENMVPHEFPDKEGFDVFGEMFPAKEVGGDLYDVYENNGIVYLVIGDVSGKGMPASLFMATTRAILRFAMSLDLPMGRMMYLLNNTISSGNKTGMFVTLFVARYDLKTRRMAFCNAGHNPLVIAEPGQKARFLKEDTNMAVGVFDELQFTEQSITLAPGTRMLLYTDGVNEAEKADKSQFGNDRMLDWFDNVNPAMSAKDAADDLLANVRAFTDGNEQNDDITIMTIKF